MSRSYLLDTSALLALIFDEPGADKVVEIIDESSIHAVNLAEVLRKMVAIAMPVDEVLERIEDLQLDVVETLSSLQVHEIARLTPEAKRLGLSLGDCVCLSVAESLGIVAVTAERRWADLQHRSLKLRHIR